MTSINGISIKSVKTFRDHEGAPIAQGNVYLNNKKIGFWSQDSWGGPDIFEDCEDVIQEQAKTFAKGYPKDRKYSSFQDSPEIFMCNLLELTENEKEYKKFAKAGRPHCIFTLDGLHIRICSFATAEECDYAMKDKTCQEEIRKGMFQDDDRIKQYVMHSLNDFQIVVDENHPAPESVW